MGKSNFGDLLLGMILGGLAGYAAAALSAPRTGEETRELLQERGRELRERAVTTLQDTRDKTGKLIDTGRGKVEGTLNQAIDRVDEVRGQSEHVVTEKRMGISEGLRRVADSLDPTTPTDNPPTPSI